MAEIEVIQPGLFSTIQDPGRFGFREYGVPVSGAMDTYAAKMANLLVGNPAETAVMEITLTGPRLLFSENALIAITGADLQPKINGQLIQNSKALIVNKEDVLSFAGRKMGCRTYLSINKGFQTATVLNSKSWYTGISEHEKLQKGMKLLYEGFKNRTFGNFATVKFQKSYLKEKTLEVFEGPEFEMLQENKKEEILSKTFSISKNNNRMAVQLEENIGNNLQPILTGPVLPGTVQFTPSGKLIVLMKDCQTTGGYPRILQLSKNALNILAQKVTADQVVFSLKSIN